MNSKDVIFNDDLEFYTSIRESSSEVCIILSDDLDSSEEELSNEYKSQIAAFISDSSNWYQKALVAVNEWAKKEHDIEPQQNNEIQLVNIFVLFEQEEKELYGLQFRVLFDIEHGCGLKINTDDYQVIEIGNADTAFC